jgi:hypothetical protein
MEFKQSRPSFNTQEVHYTSGKQFLAQKKLEGPVIGLQSSPTLPSKLVLGPRSI